MKWEDRERRRIKDYEKDSKREKDRREDMVGIMSTFRCGVCISFVLHLVCVFFLLKSRERKHLRDFLGDYNDEKDDQKYYRYVLIVYVTDVISHNVSIVAAVSYK